MPHAKYLAFLPSSWAKSFVLKRKEIVTQGMSLQRIMSVAVLGLHPQSVMPADLVRFQ